MKHPTTNHLNFPVTQDATGSFMEHLSEFHDDLMFLLVMIISLIIYLFFYIIFSKIFAKFSITITRKELCEILFTTIPIFILLFTSYPSMTTIYAADEGMFPDLSIEATGNQWYWSYDYTDFGFSYDSSMINEETEEIVVDNSRLLDVDNSMVVPVETPVHMMVSSNDVLHSWAVPSSGVKIDAVPGRLNTTDLEMNYAGMHYGQCSELCGAYHAFMPICVESIDDSSFTEWIYEETTVTEAYSGAYVQEYEYSTQQRYEGSSRGRRLSNMVSNYLRDRRSAAAAIEYRPENASTSNRYPSSSHRHHHDNHHHDSHRTSRNNHGHSRHHRHHDRHSHYPYPQSSRRSGGHRSHGS